MLQTLDDLSRQIQEKSHATVPFPMTKLELQAAIDTFVSFLSLPPDVKETIYFQLDPNSRGNEVGYKRYLRDLGHTDNREYFHYHHLAEEQFNQERSRLPILDRLLKEMRQIHDAASATLDPIIQAFEACFPGIYQGFFPPHKRPHFYLRFLKYDRAAPGAFLAKGHYDRGGCTLAIAESAPGLRMGVDDLHLHEVTHDEGKALFMPGLKFLATPSNDFPPTWHDVIQKGEDVYSEEIARWAIVFFADSGVTSDITYQAAHTPRRAA